MEVEVLPRRAKILVPRRHCHVVGHSGLSCLRVRRDRRYEDLAVLLGSPYQRADVVSRLKETPHTATMAMVAVLGRCPRLVPRLLPPRLVMPSSRGA